MVTLPVLDKDDACTVIQLHCRKGRGVLDGQDAANNLDLQAGRRARENTHVSTGALQLHGVKLRPSTPTL